MRKALTLLLLSYVCLAELFSPGTLSTALGIAERYLASAQLSCGSLISCTSPSVVDYSAWFMFFIKNYDDVGFLNAINFDNYLYTSVYPVWSVISPGSSDYNGAPFADAIASLSTNITNELVQNIELMISKYFDQYGYDYDAPSATLIYGTEYDLLSTLYALVIAEKSESVDGYLSLNSLLQTLNSDFWNYLESFVSDPSVGSAPLNARALALLMWTAIPNFRQQACVIANTTYFSNIYNDYKSLTVVTMSSDSDKLGYLELANAALFCAAWGYINATYARDVAEWILFSWVVNNGGSWTPSASTVSMGYAIADWLVSLYQALLGETPSGYELLMSDRWPGLPSVQTNTMTVTKYMDNVIVKTVTTNGGQTTVTLSAPETREFTFKPIPAVTLLGVLYAVLRKRGRQ